MRLSELAAASIACEICQFELSELSMISSAILSGHDLKNTLFISIGRSGSAIVACMKNLAGVNVMTLPLSHFRWKPNEDEAVLLPKMFQLLDQCLLFKKESSSCLNWVFMDYCITGATLYSVSQVVPKYLAIRSAYRPKLHYLALLAPECPSFPLETAFYPGSLTSIALNPYPGIAKSMRQQRYDWVAEYDSFDPWVQEPHEILKRRDYPLFFQVLREKMLLKTSR